MSPMSEQFEKSFGHAARYRGKAHGRVNLMGEHADDNGGLALLRATPQATSCYISPRGDDLVWGMSLSTEFSDPIEVYRLGQEVKTGKWLDCVQGVTAVLRAAGHHHSGFEILVESDVPIALGLASSAALEVSLLRALREAFDIPIEDEEIARLAQKAESLFVGASPGIMDQMSASFADPQHALFLDTRTLRFERVKWPQKTMSLFVIHSGIEYSDIGGGGYAERRAQCEEAARRLGVAVLSDLAVDDLAKLANLPLDLEKRARHVITENERVIEMVEALRESDAKKVGELFSASHVSQAELFEISTPEIDTLVEIATAQPEVFGARLTGRGFGGAICFVAEADAGPDLAERIQTAYRDATGHEALCLLPGVASEAVSARMEPALSRQPEA